MKKWLVPEDATWEEEYFYVCFNNDCPYYKDGWVWMKKNFNQQASYRYAINPTTGNCLPIPVWSDEATLEMIVEDDEGEGE